MISPLWLFLGFRGRIGRRAYWLGLILLVAISPFSIWTVLSQDPFRDAIAQIQALGWSGLAWTLALFIPLAALNTKRLHDLGKSGIFAVIFYAPAALASVRLFLGDQPWVGQSELAIEWIAAFAGVAGVWFLIQLGLFSGTRGPNKYGPARGAQPVEAI